MQMLSGAPPPGEGAHRSGSAWTSPATTAAQPTVSATPSRALADLESGQQAHRSGPPPKGGIPQPGATRQPPKPRTCRLCKKELPSGAKLFEHVLACRVTSLTSGVLKRHVVPADANADADAASVGAKAATLAAPRAIATQPTGCTISP